MKRPTVAVVGASADRSKYGNKAVRAYVMQGYDVFPVNPKEPQIEGLKVYRSVSEIPVDLDRVTVFLPPALGIKVVEEIARKGTRELFLNPGSESDELVEKARTLGLNVIVACSISNIGMHPGKKWYHSVWSVLCALFIFLGPLALPLLWKSPSFSKRWKVILTVLVLAYTGVLILSVWLAIQGAMKEMQGWI